MDINDKYSSGHHIKLQGCSHKLLLKGTNCNETIVEQLLICDEVYTVYRESWAGEKFGKLTLFEHLVEESLVN